jgi:uncharacterized membrane protein
MSRWPMRIWLSQIWPSRPWQRWLALGLAVAVLTHLLTVWALPRLIMREAMSRIAQETAAQPAPQAATGVYLPPPTDHTQRRIVMPSPDLLYATCTLDLSKGPVRITAEVAYPRYWSVALYGANSDNFFVVNDRSTAVRSATGTLLDLRILPSGTDRATTAADGESTMVEAPSRKVLLLMRLLLTDDPADLALAQAARSTLRCTDDLGNTPNFSSRSIV